MAASSSKMLQVARKTGRKADQRKTKRKKSNSRNSYRPLTSDYHDLSTNVMVVNTLLEIDVNHIVCKNMYIYRIYIYICILAWSPAAGALPEMEGLGPVLRGACHSSRHWAGFRRFSTIETKI